MFEVVIECNCSCLTFSIPLESVYEMPSVRVKGTRNFVTWSTNIKVSGNCFVVHEIKYYLHLICNICILAYLL